MWAARPRRKQRTGSKALPCLDLLLAVTPAYPLAGQAPSPEAVSITHVTVEFELHRNLFTADKQLVGLMFRAGVPLLAGTDAMNPFCFPDFSLHDELALLVESGLTPLAALQSATLHPAEFLGRTGEQSLIAPGKRADLVLLSADPLADINNTMQIQAAWLHGKYLDRASLDRLLEDAKRRSGKGKLH